jgi:hypothetical protein
MVLTEEFCALDFTGGFGTLEAITLYSSLPLWGYVTGGE